MSHEITTQQPPSILAKMAQRFSVEPNKMLSTLKATAFKGDVSNEQMMALLIVADQYGLNPWTKEIYAFPDKNNGIVPVVGVDGWSRIINQHDQFDGMDFNQSETMVELPGAKATSPEWIECVMHRKDRGHPIVVREYIDEVYKAPYKGKFGDVTGPWQTHPKRFLRHKAMIQCARMAFGFVGVFDQDEAERIVERDITPQGHSEFVPAQSRTEAVKEKLKAKATPEPISVDTDTGEIADKAPEPPAIDPDDAFLKALG
jgi:phage recombination protein Bet